MKFTREGKRFFIATVLIAFAAFNTANNLIYLVFSMMLSILFLSIVILKWNLRGLTLKISHDKPLFANRISHMKIALANDKKYVASYSVRVLMPEKVDGKVYIPKVSFLSETEQDIPVRYERRGIYRYGDFIIESSFPFLFFRKRFHCRCEGEVVVYPEIKELDTGISELVNNRYEPSQTRIGKSDEFSTIREFRYGDDWRGIHWKASAKSAQFMVKEYASYEPKKITILLDNLKPLHEASFEKAVSLAASMTDRFLNEGYFVRLLTCRKMIPFGNRRDHLFKVLDVLAGVEGQDVWECPVSVDDEGVHMVILSSEGSRLRRLITGNAMVIYASTL